MITITIDKNLAEKMDRQVKKLVKAHAIIPEEHTKRVVFHAILAVKEQIAFWPLIKSGKFYNSVNGRVFKNHQSQWIGIVGAPSPAHFLELGTKPHIILPRNKKALRWEGGGRGIDRVYNAEQFAGVHFAKSVKHPGTRPYRVFETASKKTTAYAQRLLKDMVDMAGKKIKGIAQ